MAASGRAAAAATIVEVDDDRWDTLVGGGDDDPYCARPYLAAATAHDGRRAVLVAGEGPGWSGTYPVVLQPLPGGRWLARSPDYGGPSLRLATEAEPARVRDAANAYRRAADAALAAQGVVSEVFLLSPWLPFRAVVAAAWDAWQGKPVCLVHAAGHESRWNRLRKGRRSDIARARRDLDLTWAPFDAGAAGRFATHYQSAMERLAAAERWRFDAGWFRALAGGVDGAGGGLMAATAQGPGGGATALFLPGRTAAAYFLACRWGDTPGAPSLALWTGIDELVRTGVRGITLGGGATDMADDPVLAFKRSFADEEVPLLVGARVFDADAQARAEAGGQARPLPPGAVPV